MSEIINKWITKTTGVVMNMNPEIFAADVMDGTVLVRILHSYSIVNQDQLLMILPTDISSIAYKNLKKIGLWLELIDINCKEEFLIEISLKKPFQAIKLFYEVYLALHDKDRLHFIAKKRGTERLHPSDTRFEISLTADEKNDITESPEHPFCEPLIANRGVIEWNQNRYEKLLEKYEAQHETYVKYIQEKFGIPYQDKFNKFESKREPSPTTPERIETEDAKSVDYTYEELAQQEKEAIQMELFQQDPKMAKKIINKLKQKRRKDIQEMELKSHKQKLLLMELWNKLLAEQEREFEETISTKMIKQSEFEKQMVTKMIDVRQQKINIIKNRRFIDDETMKRREEEFLEHVFLREKGVGDQKYSYYFEKQRAIELHRRLLVERLRLKAERYYNMCSDVVKDITNIAIRHSEFKELFNEQVPKRIHKEWTNLFIKQKPIFDALDNVEDIIKNKDKELPENIEEIYCVEIERQNALDQRDFENYFNLEWPWRLHDLKINCGNDLLTIELGMNVLGHNVHRVLYTKYPKAKPTYKPDIPSVKIATCINGIPDLTILPVLQTLLNAKKVQVIEIQEAINYCLDAFKAEMKTESIDNVLMEETDAALAELKQDKGQVVKRPVKGEKLKTVPDSKKKRSENCETIPTSSGFDDKQSQTPDVFPCEAIPFSPKAELGKTAYDLLNIGEQITDHLLVAMFIEYLKSLKKIEGWALINFPTTFAQAVLLEEALTGMQVPGISDEFKLDLSTSIGDTSDLEYRGSQWNQGEQNARKRKSKLLPNLVTVFEESLYDTYLTAYIHAQRANENLETKNEFDEEEEEEKNKEDYLENFYSEQGCNYAFYYKTFELATIKHLAKLIIGDCSLPRKTSVELFGDTVLYLEANLNEKCSTPGKDSKSDKKSVLNKKVSKTGKPNVKVEKVVSDDKEVQVPEVAHESEKVNVEPPVEPVEPTAGEASWRYTDLSFPDHFQIGLATLWENLEEVYCCDFKELFFLKRLILNAFIPYLTYIRHHMDIYIARPDEKQTLLHKFQSIYNEIDDDMRDDEELKAEIHCRIAEFREKLFEICDRRMKDSEQERQRIIAENWVAAQACELTNNYITAMQLEIDRSCDSFQFLTDYYFGVITKMPSEEPVLHKSNLRKVSIEEGDTSSMSIIGHVKAETITILTEPEAESYDTPFHHSLQRNAKVGESHVSKWQSSCNGLAAKLDAMLKPGKKVADKGKPAAKGERKLPKFTELNDDVKEVGPRLISEWNCALQGEYLRVKLRLNMLKERGMQELNDILSCSKYAFHGVYNDIRENYNKEISSIDTACEVLARAVEAETRLQPELLLDGNKFYVESNVLLFPEPLPTPEPPVTEPDIDGVFTLTQLNALTNILMDLAPNGSLPERAFVFLLQDMIVQNAEDGKCPMVPVLWQKIMPVQVSQLSRYIFGDVEFIDWKDFIIYNMCIPFPTEDELLETRESFRKHDPDKTETVLNYQFNGVHFWFEKEFDPKNQKQMRRLKLVKELLFRLFRIKEDTLNYTALLLAFCKDVNPVMGFVKALTLAFGKYICWNSILGNIYVANISEQRYLDDQEELRREQAHEEAVKAAESTMGSVIDKTVHVCESVIIEEYVSETSVSPEIDKSSGNSFSSMREERSLTDIVFEDLKDQTLQELFNNEMSFSDRSKCQDMLILNEVFSNVEIGFQPAYIEPKVYLLPFEVVLTILTCCLPWHARAQTVNDQSLRERLEVIYADVKSPDFNNTALAHVLLNNRAFKDLLRSISKFLEKCPSKIVENMLAKDS